MASLLYLSSLLLLNATSLFAQIDTAIINHDSPIPRLTGEAWNNPALTSFKYSSSLTEMSGRFMNCSKERYGEFKAETYIIKGNITLTADAKYDNGAMHNVRFCENVDIQKVYPYLTYDAVGGNLNLERYAFGGCVTIALGNRWTIGASGLYNAGLYYRNVDPRPKDITALLEISAGASYSLTEKYRLALNGDYSKYKQTCEISFMSELGSSKIYHMTGLGSHYARFAGQGLSSYYNGFKYGGALTLFPLSSGIYANVGAHIEKINHILTDLNKLPMSKIDNRSLCAEAGYKTDIWGVTAFCNFERRHGYENIFGDASTAQYPMIASLGMFLSNSNRIGLRSLYSLKIGKTRLSFSPEIIYTHYSESYREPAKSIMIDNLSAGTGAEMTMLIKNRVILRADACYRYIPALSSNSVNITTDNPDIEPFVTILSEGFDKAASTRQFASVNAGLDILLKNKYAVTFDASYSHLSGEAGVSTFSISFKF